MSSLRFDHVAIPIVDPAEARSLFGDVLGLPLVAAHSGDDWSGSPWLMMIYGLPGGGQIALCALAGKKASRKPAVDLPHYAFSVRDRETLKRWRRRLKEAGFDVRDEDHGGGQRSVYFEDRSGTTWEITAPPSRNHVDPQAARVVERWLTGRPAT